MKSIDINSDMGEIPEDIAGGAQEALMPSLTSVNIACGGHAGDAQSMRTTIEQAQRRRLAIGAHPGYPDRANFGRVEFDMSPEAIADSVATQIEALANVAASLHVRLTHVKAHGAMYNAAARNELIAVAIAEGVARVDRGLTMIGLAGSVMLEVFRDEGFATAAEAFADRRYEPDGSLRPRKFSDALITDPAEAARQAVRIVEEGTIVAIEGSKVAIDAQTICIHSDSPGAAQIAAAVAQALHLAGIALRPFRRVETHGQ